MSIEYRAYWSNDSESSKLMQHLRSVLSLAGGEEISDKFSVRSTISDGLNYIVIRRLDPLSSYYPPYMAEANGIDAKLAVTFVPYTPKMAESEKQMIRDMVVLAAEFDGDFVLVTIGDTVLFRRKGGLLELNTNASFWNDELRALVPEPYRMVAMERTDG